MTILSSALFFPSPPTRSHSPSQKSNCRYFSPEHAALIGTGDGVGTAVGSGDGVAVTLALAGAFFWAAAGIGARTAKQINPIARSFMTLYTPLRIRWREAYPDTIRRPQRGSDLRHSAGVPPNGLEVAMRRALILFLLVAAAALPLPARTDAGRELSDAEAFVEQYLSTFNAADPVALAGLYAEDGLVLPPAGGSVRGREAIRKFWSNSSRRSLSFNMLQKNVCGETGFFVGTYTARENRSGRFYPASPFVLLGRSGQTGKPSPISGNFTLC